MSRPSGSPKASGINPEQTIHPVGTTSLQDTKDCYKFVFPSQVSTLGILDDNKRLLWVVDEARELPVVTTIDNLVEVNSRYGKPDIRENGKTVTLPIDYTPDAHNGGHPDINFAKDDTLVFFAVESEIKTGFSRLYITTIEEYQEIRQGCIQVVWGEAFNRPPLGPESQERVREVRIDRQHREVHRVTYPASKDWVSLEYFDDQVPETILQPDAQPAADDD